MRNCVQYILLLLCLLGYTAAQVCMNRTLIDSGASHTCAVLDNGWVKCWGYNNFGQLGIDSTTNVGTTPTGTTSMSVLTTGIGLGSGRTAVQVSSGDSHSCAVLDNGQIKCWGYNNNGQLGMGDVLARGGGVNEMGDNLIAVDLGSGRTAVQVACGTYFTCAVLDNGQVKCWGQNNYGQLGLGDMLARGDGANEMGGNLPAVDLGYGRTAVQIACGESHTCALLDDGQVKCWGRGTFGQLDIGSTSNMGDNVNEMGDNLIEIDLGSERTVVQIACGAYHTCAVLDNGWLKCWGYNNNGQLGLDHMNNIGTATIPLGTLTTGIELGSGRTAVQVACGLHHSCAILDNGWVKCWGYNLYGQLGIGNTTNVGTTNTAPNSMSTLTTGVDLGSGRTAVQVSCGMSHSCAMLDNGKVECWGRNAYGQLGIGSTATVGSGVVAMSTLTGIDLGRNLTCTLPALASTPAPTPVPTPEPTAAPTPAPSLVASLDQIPCTGCNGACGVLEAPTGTFTDGSGSSQYVANADCTWIIAPNVSSTTGLKLVINQIDTESNYDFLTIWSCNDRSCVTGLTKLGYFSATYNTAQTFVFPTSFMKVQFTSDSNANGQGFSATYSVQCPGGTYMDYAAAKCTVCPHDYYPSEGGVLATECLPCHSGIEHACTICTSGTHWDSATSTCIACPAGTYSSIMLSNSSSICSECFECLACPLDTYSSEEGVSSCLACPPYTHSDMIGSTSQTTCCAPWEVFNTDQQKCIDTCSDSLKMTNSTAAGAAYCMHKASICPINESASYVSLGAKPDYLIGYHIPRNAGDINGDGIDDLVFAGQGWNAELLDVYVLFGRQGGWPTNVTLDYENLMDGVHGFKVIMRPPNINIWWYGQYEVGDVNADGYADIIFVDEGIGAVYVLFGKPSFESTGGYINITQSLGVASIDQPWDTRQIVPKTAYFVAVYTSTVAYVGDVNGDGIGDYVLGNYWEGGISLMLGNSEGLVPPQIAIWCGGPLQAVVALGDINGDGLDDFALAQNQDWGRGNYITVLFGSKSVWNSLPLVTWNSRVQHTWYIFSSLNVNQGFNIRQVLGDNGQDAMDDQWIYTLGDINGDGMQDFAVRGATEQGAYIFHGRRQWELEYTVGADLLAQSKVAYIDAGYRNAYEWYIQGAKADMNGDGIDDMLLRESDTGTVRIMAGSTTFHPGDSITIEASKLDVFWSSSRASQTLRNYTIGGSIGDLNGDGYTDLALAHTLFDGQSMDMQIYYGCPHNCSAGTFSKTFNKTTHFSHVCITCKAGTYSTGVGSAICTSCPVGTYSNIDGSTSCTMCPAGTYSDTIGASSISTCISCPVGTYSDINGSTSCTMCPAGTYSATIGAASTSTCISCPPWTYSATIGSSSNATCCASWEPFDNDQQKCINYAQITCTGCNGACGVLEAPTGTFTDGSGSSQYVTNADCTWIIAPNVSSTTGLKLVFNEVQTEKDYDYVKIWSCKDRACITGLTQLDSLTGNYYTLPTFVLSTLFMKVQFTSDSDVNKQGFSATYSVQCPDGTYMDYAAAKCTSCPHDYYSSTGEVLVTECLPCDNGIEYACRVCTSGTHWDSNTSTCVACPPGTYSSIMLSNSSSTCSECFECLACPVDTYSLDERVSACLACPPYTHSDIGSTSNAMCCASWEAFNNDQHKCIDKCRDSTQVYIKQVSSLSSFTCALTTDGMMKCWGNNYDGTIGNEDLINRGKFAAQLQDNLPYIDLGTRVTVKKMTESSIYTQSNCAILSNGKLKCWGSNNYAVLGLGLGFTIIGDEPGEMGDNLPYVDLGTGRTVIDICASEHHKCALLDNYQVKCWGDNGGGGSTMPSNLGYGDTINRGDTTASMGDNLPYVDLGTNRTVKQLSCGFYHNCAVLDNDMLKCWGNSYYAQLGYGDYINRGDTPGSMGDNLPYVNLGANRTVKQVTIGLGQTCAILDNDKAKCWGNNYWGQCGTESQTDVELRIGDDLPYVNLGDGVIPKSLSCGVSTTCVLTSDNRVKCWGYNYGGLLGIPNDSTHKGKQPGSMGDALPFINFGPARTTLSVSMGAYVICVLLDNHEVKCWGDNEYGQLGNGIDSTRTGGDLGINYPYSIPLDVACEICMPGTQRVVSGINRCAACPMGSFSNQSNSMECTLCPVGTYSNISNSASCTMCPAGTYSATIGASSISTCISCLAGTYSATIGAVSNSTCTRCPVGKIAATAGSSACTSCLQIFIGQYVTCAIFSNKQTKCWGDNERKLLGFGHTDPMYFSPESMKNLPAINFGAGRHAVQMSISRSFACAVLDNGNLGCWGIELNVDMPDMPINIGEGSKATQVSTGDGHACVLLDNGQIKCWGSNTHGQLGTGNTVSLTSPSIAVDLGAEMHARQVMCSEDYCCALLHNGKVKCWGQNGGQLGTGDYVDVLSPQEVYLGAEVHAVHLSGGYSHVCALLDNGKLLCWGGNWNGQLGINSQAVVQFPHLSVPAMVGENRTVTQFSANSAVTCVVLDDGAVKCFGWNGYTMLGIGSWDDMGKTPGSMQLLPSVNLRRAAVQVAVGFYHACAVLDNGGAKCWGFNWNGELGTGYRAPVFVGDTPESIVDINYAILGPSECNHLQCAAGEITQIDGFTCANCSAGSIYMQGGTCKSCLQVFAGSYVTCVILSNRDTKCWGDGSYGMLGMGNEDNILTIHNIPAINFGPGRYAVYISTSYSSNCAILDNGELKCWGYSNIGMGSTGSLWSPSSSPINLGENRTAIHVSNGGGTHTCVVLDNGMLKCWGGNGNGQLGTGNTNDLLSPSDPLNSGNLRVTQVACGYAFTCALIQTQEIICWGRNGYGQLGTGNNNGINYPEYPTVNFGWDRYPLSVVAGDDHACAVLSDGNLLCWGSNSRGQLGIDSTSNVNAPSIPAMVGAGRTVVSVAAQSSSTCAILDNGDLKCWGYNGNGMLGVGSFNDVGKTSGSMLSLVPVNLGRTVVQVSMGTEHTCAVLDNGGAKCWGYNSHGELGTGYRVPEFVGDTPESVADMKYALLGPNECTPVCPVGNFTLDGGLTCKTCSPGSYSLNPNTTACIQKAAMCPANTTHVDAASLQTTWFQYTQWDQWSVPDQMADVNGDGLNDLIAVARGKLLVLFGRAGDLPVVNGKFDFSTLDGTNGFTADLQIVPQMSQYVAAGDVNGDGYSDIIILSDRTSSDQNMVVFGKPYFASGTVSFAGLDLTASISRLEGVAFSISDPIVSAYKGLNVVGDFNGDGFTDFLWGMGDFQVVFGAAVNPPLQVVNLRSLNGQIFYFTTALGDIDGDGCDDFALQKGDWGKKLSTITIVFGQRGLWNANMNIIDMRHTTVYTKILDYNQGDYKWTNGYFDVNGDGYSDVYFSDEEYVSEKLIILGRPSAEWPTHIYLNDTTNIFYIESIKLSDYEYMMKPIGDFNNDGMRDYIFYNARSSYWFDTISIIFGGDWIQTTGSLTLEAARQAGMLLVFDKVYPTKDATLPTAIYNFAGDGSYSFWYQIFTDSQVGVLYAFTKACAPSICPVNMGNLNYTEVSTTPLQFACERCTGDKFLVSSTCQLCPSGNYVTAGMSSCLECPAGSYSNVSNSSTCTACQAGTYSASIGAGSASACISCPAGTYSATVGAVLNTTCISCPEGSHSAAGSTYCTTCALGTYAEKPGQATCKNKYKYCPSVAEEGLNIPRTVFNVNVDGDMYDSFNDVSKSMGDVNGDGMTDIIFFTYYRIMVVFGTAEGNINTGTYDLDSLDGTNGFVVVFDHDGYFNSMDVGDLNADGKDEIIFVWGKPPNNGLVVLYGSSKFDAVLSLVDINFDSIESYKPNLLCKAHEAAVEWSGKVAFLGDVNGDGFGDFIWGEKSFAKLVFGSLDLNASVGNGILLAGMPSMSYIMPLGDVDNDGFNDFAGKAQLGPVFDIIFGKADWQAPTAYAGLRHTQVTITTNTPYINNIVKLGDFNGDGYADFALKAWGSDAEMSYYIYSAPIILGRASSEWPVAFTVGSIGEPTNYTMPSVDYALINHAGDVNGDGIDDVIFALYGQTTLYVIFGSKSFKEGMTVAVGLPGVDSIIVGAKQDYNADIYHVENFSGDGYRKYMMVSKGITQQERTYYSDAYVLYLVHGCSLTTCPMGTVANNHTQSLSTPMMIECQRCFSPYYYNTTTSTCKLCSPGTHVAGGAYSVSCVQCQQGTYSIAANSSTCTACPLTYSIAIGGDSNATCCASWERFDANQQKCVTTCRDSLKIFITQVTTFHELSCIMTSDGRMKCWGANYLGQLGIGTSDHMGNDPGEMGDNLPYIDFGIGVTVKKMTDRSISRQTICAIMNNNQLKCWGDGYYGKPGFTGKDMKIGDSPDEMGDNLPYVNLGANRSVIDVCIAFQHECAILDNNRLKCWGWNGFGSLGYGDTQDRGSSPSTMGDNLPYVDLGTNRTVKKISCGFYHTCAILDNDKVKCWGASWSGELGYGNYETKGDTPLSTGDNLPYVDLGTNRTAKEVSAGFGFTCVILDNDNVKCWGNNELGSCGTESLTAIELRTGDALPYVNLGTDVVPKSLQCGEVTTCMLTINNKVKCWGYNDGMLALVDDFTNKGYAPGSMGDALHFIDFGPGRTVQNISLGYCTACVLLDNHEIKCWGDNKFGEVGSGNAIYAYSGNVGIDYPYTKPLGPACKICMPGTQLAVTGTNKCTICSAGSYTNETNMAGCMLCPVGTYSQIEAAAECSKCPVGSYSATIGAASNSTCISCPAGSYSATIGAASSSTCISCPAGSYSTTIGAASNTTCILCPIGTYSSALGASSSSMCTKCAANAYSGVIGATSISTCQQCIAGFHPVGEGSSCKPCIKIVASLFGTCEITHTADLKCWGHNAYGALGTGSTTNLPSPPSSPAISHVIQASSSYHTCAILDDGSLKCWGRNNFGQLGNGDTDNWLSALNVSVKLGNGRSAVQVSCGTYHTCAILDNGQLKCWGNNVFGQLGLGNNVALSSPSSTAINLGENRTAVQVSCSDAFTCALLDTGVVKCWGRGYEGQLGLGSNVQLLSSPSQSAINLGRAVLQITTGSYGYACALLDNHQVKCWGYNWNGQLGYQTQAGYIYTPFTTHVNIGTGRSALKIDTKESHTCALLDNGAVYCWGINWDGCLGVGFSAYDSNRYSPDGASINLGEGRTALDISVGYGHSCAVLDNYHVKCWGQNINGQLGLGDTVSRGETRESIATLAYIPLTSNPCMPLCKIGTYTPDNQFTCINCPTGSYSALPGVASCTRNEYSTKLYPFEFTTCGITYNGEMRCWGNGEYGGLGIGYDGYLLFPSNTSINFGDGRSAVQAKVFWHTCTLLDNGALKCWGENSVGQLGNGDTLQTNVPGNSINFGTGRTVSQFDMNWGQTCAVLDNAQLKCFGRNTDGILGVGITGQDVVTTPTLVNVGALRTVRHFSAGWAYGNQHMCAILDNYGLKCWGRNAYGQLGYEHTNTLTAPSANVVNVGEGSTVKYVLPFNLATCAILDNGGVKCWGKNSEGQLGYGHTNDISNGPPSESVNLGQNMTARHMCTPGGHAVCALLENGDIKCWGQNNAGQLGMISESSPPQETSPPTNPVNLGIRRKAVDMQCGKETVCALLDNGYLTCWGNNTNGYLGYGNTVSPKAAGDPVPVGKDRTVLKFFMSDYNTCALLDDNKVKCWGANWQGQLGNGNTQDQGATPKTIPGNLPYAELGVNPAMPPCEAGTYSLDDQFTCTQCISGTFSDAIGATEISTCEACETGTYSLDGQSTCPGCYQVVNMLIGTDSMCAVTHDWNIRCWGYGNQETPVNGVTHDVMVPSETPIDLGFWRTVKVAKLTWDGYHVCVILDKGELKCWGSNSNGQLGIGNKVARAIPTNPIDLGDGKTAVDLQTYGNSTCVILDNGQLKCWGSNYDGALGVEGFISGSSVDNDVTTPTLINVGEGAAVKEVFMYIDRTCAILNNSQLKCWGENGAGQLGTGDRVMLSTPSSDPINVGYGRTVKKAFPLHARTCAILDDDTLKCWGSNVNGMLGYGNETDMLTPSNETINFGQGRTVRDVCQIAAFSTCALLDNGDIKCWGLGLSGELGYMAQDPWYVTSPPTDPINLGTGRKAVQLHCGNMDGSACALLDNGDITCWGKNQYGYLGYENSNVTQPGTPINLGESKTAINMWMSKYNVCALLDNYHVKCWGANRDGQLGIGNSINVGGSVGSMESLPYLDLGTNPCMPPCPAGSYGRDGYFSCEKCPSGTFSTTVGATSNSSCEPCMEGTYNGLNGQTICLDCMPGTVGLLQGMSRCAVVKSICDHDSSERENTRQCATTIQQADLMPSSTIRGVKDSNLGYSVNYVSGDINGDGIDDLLMPDISETDMTFGVYVLFGKKGGWEANLAPTGLAAMMDGVNGFKIVMRDSLDEGVGYYTVDTGDVNGDGYADIVFGDDAYKTSFVFFGRQNFAPTGGLLNKTALGYSESKQSNFVDGVGYYIRDSLSYFGMHTASVGDVNGDGIDDFASSGWYNNKGSIVLGTVEKRIGTQIRLFSSPNINTFMGLGDVNGDGIDDIGILQMEDRNNLRVAVLFGRKVWAPLVDVDLNINGENGFYVLGSQDWFADWISNPWIHRLGDINGDHMQDFALAKVQDEWPVTSLDASNRGNPLPIQSDTKGMYIILGRQTWDANYTLTQEAVDQGALGYIDIGNKGMYGFSVMGALADLDGDGVDDMIIRDEILRSIHILPGDQYFLGGHMTVPSLQDLAFFGSASGIGIISRLISWVTPIGDVNGDGSMDLAAYNLLQNPNGVDFIHIGTVYVMYGCAHACHSGYTLTTTTDTCNVERPMCIMPTPPEETPEPETTPVDPDIPVDSEPESTPSDGTPTDTTSPEVAITTTPPPATTTTTSPPATTTTTPAPATTTTTPAPATTTPPPSSPPFAQTTSGMTIIAASAVGGAVVLGYLAWNMSFISTVGKSLTAFIAAAPHNNPAPRGIDIAFSKLGQSLVRRNTAYEPLSTIVSM